MKKCRICHLIKEDEQFYKNRKSILRQCKTCASKAFYEARKENDLKTLTYHHIPNSIGSNYADHVAWAIAHQEVSYEETRYELKNANPPAWREVVLILNTWK